MHLPRLTAAAAGHIHNQVLLHHQLCPVADPAMFDCRNHYLHRPWDCRKTAAAAAVGTDPVPVAVDIHTDLIQGSLVAPFVLQSPLLSPGRYIQVASIVVADQIAPVTDPPAAAGQNSDSAPGTANSAD